MNLKVAYLNNYSNDSINAFLKHIDKDKQKKIMALKKYEDKKRSIIGQMLLKDLLQDDYYKYNFYTNKFGKIYTNKKNTYFSISHSNDLVGCIISNKEIGLDIEKIKDVDLNIIKMFATNYEKEYILKKDSYKRFFEIYTLKEAYFKMLGTNLDNLKSVEFHINNNKITCSDPSVIAKINYDIDNYIISIVEKRNV